MQKELSDVFNVLGHIANDLIPQVSTHADLLSASSAQLKTQMEPEDQQALQQVSLLLVDVASHMTNTLASRTWLECRERYKPASK